MLDLDQLENIADFLHALKELNIFVSNIDLENSRIKIFRTLLSILQPFKLFLNLKPQGESK